MRDAGRSVPGGVGLGTDAAVYAVAALFATWILTTTTFHTFRSWAQIAAPSYLAGAVATLLVVVLTTRDAAHMGASSGRRVRRTRLAVLGAVTVGACLVPTALLVARRASVGPEYAQSEVVVIESAARAVLQGADPYTSVFSSSELAGRAPGIREHFPYLPGMVLFGLPRATVGGVWTDARVAFLAVTVAVTLLVAARLGFSRGLRMWQLLVAAPTGALALATGGDDIPLLALAALALVLLAEGRTTPALVVLVALACTKQTMWPLGVAVLVTLPRGRPRTHAAMLASIPAALFAVVVSASPGGLTDLVAYPLGQTPNQTPAEMTTIGSTLSAGLGLGAGAGTTRQLLAVVVLVCAAAMASEAALRAWWRGRPDASSSPAAAVATRFGVLFLAAVAFAPVGRPGYLVYPLSALVWARLLAQQEGGRPGPVSWATMVEAATVAERTSPSSTKESR